MDKEYAVDENLFFTTGDSRGVSLKYLVISGEEGVGDIYSIAILYSNLRKLYREMKDSRFVYWNTKDESLTIKGDDKQLGLTFNIPEPPYKTQRSLSPEESDRFKAIVQQLLEKEPGREGLS